MSMFRIISLSRPLSRSQFVKRCQHTEAAPCPVNSHNEWDPLEEVIVGGVDSHCVPLLTTEVEAVISEDGKEFYRQYGGKSFPSELVSKAKEEIKNFCAVLKGEGIIVRRPDVCDYEVGYTTPDFHSPRSVYAGMPRDNLMVFGNEIIEAPMAWRSRFFEYRAYRRLMVEYFNRGAKWTTAPKPLMPDELYDPCYPMNDLPARKKLAREGKFITTELEPCFDAADFYRVGKDIFAQRSHVTNFCGIEWLQKHLGDEYTVHTIFFENYETVMHLDSSIFIPKPGIVMFNPGRPSNRRDFFIRAGWKVLDSPLPTIPDSHPMWTASKWLTMNMLSLDTERVIVESQEEPLIKLLEGIGIKCIRVPFRNVFSFGGGFHCYTCDVRRKGKLESYF